MRLQPLRRVLPSLGLLAALAACSGGTDRSRPHDVLLITVDTLRADHLGCYGAANDPTPRIDRLAREGVRFLDASTPVPITLPAHASLFTGAPPPVHGVRDNGDFRLGTDLPTLAEKLSAEGFDTAAFVGAVVLDAAGGLDRGFAHYDDTIRVPLAADATGAASYPDRPAAEVVDAALSWIRGVGEDARFFAWVHLFDPHAPYYPPEPARSRYGATYEGEVRYTDAEIGRLLDGLEETGRGGRTLVVLTADHGEGLGEHGETTHGFFLYQSTVRIPMILRLPEGLPAGVEVEAPVSLLDLYPTILGLVGLPTDEPTWGTSLVDAAEGSAPLPERSLYLETYLPFFQMGWSGSRGLRQESWKYLSATGPELYDLESDPRELGDRAADDSGTADRLAAALRREAERMDARAAAAGASASMSDAERARLRSLGYLAGGSPEVDDLVARAAIRPDTRERIHLVDELLKAAPAAIDVGDPEGLDRLTALVDEDPDNPRMLSILGTALLRHGRTEDALSRLRRAAQIAPDDARIQASLAAVLLRAGRTDEAMQAAGRVSAMGGGAPEVRRLHGNLLLDAGKPVEAEAEFRAALGRNPGDLAALRGLGRSLAAQRRHAEAAQALNALLASEPDALEELVLAATAEYRLGRNSDAEPKFRRALEEQPGHVGALVGLALILGEGGDDRAAADLLSRAATAAPDDPGVLMLHGVAAARAGDVAAARSSLERSLALDPDQATARQILDQLPD